MVTPTALIVEHNPKFSYHYHHHHHGAVGAELDDVSITHKKIQNHFDIIFMYI